MRAFSQLRISTRLAVLTILSFVSLLIAGGIATSFLQDRMTEERIAAARFEVEAVHGLAGGLEAQVKAGSISRDQAMARFRDAIHSMRFHDGTGYFFAHTLEGVSFAHGWDPKQEGSTRLNVQDSDGKYFVQDMVNIAKTQKEGVISYIWGKPGTDEKVRKLTFIKAFEPWNLLIGTGAYTDDIAAAVWAVMVKLGIATLALAAVSAGIAFAINRSVARSLRGLEDKMARLATGDHAIEIPETAWRNEIGDMARAVEVFKQNAVENARLQVEQRAAEEESRRNAEALRQIEAKRTRDEAEHARAATEAKQRDEAQRRAEAETQERAQVERRKRDMLALADGFEASVNGIVQSVAAASSELQSTAGAMSGTASETSRQAADVANVSEEASANVQTVAAAAEELSSSIAEIGRQVSQSSRIANQAVAEADKTNDTVRSLSEAAQKIGKVVELINSIAGQTNLLALNATIEAARAGEAGKGFAVVASEVKSLANQTAKATEDISQQIASMQQVSAAAVDAIQGIGSTIVQINEIATSIAAAIEEQGAATQEIARNVQQAAAGTRNVSGNLVKVTSAAGKTGEAASKVLASSTALSKQSDALKIQVQGFLAKIRAA